MLLFKATSISILVCRLRKLTPNTGLVLHSPSQSNSVVGLIQLALPKQQTEFTRGRRGRATVNPVSLSQRLASVTMLAKLLKSCLEQKTRCVILRTQGRV